MDSGVLGRLQRAALLLLDTADEAEAAGHQAQQGIGSIAVVDPVESKSYDVDRQNEKKRWRNSKPVARMATAIICTAVALRPVF